MKTRTIQSSSLRRPSKSGPPRFELIRAWASFHDPRVLVVKPSGFTDADVSKLQKIRSVLYRPGSTNQVSLYDSAVLSPDPGEFADLLRHNFRLNLEPPTDDKPYLLDVVPGDTYFRPAFWKVLFSGAGWTHAHRHVFTLLAFCLLSLGAVLGPVAVARGRALRAGGVLQPLAYFSLLGGGFMLVEMGVLQKLSVLVGHPGYSLAVGLGSLVLFTGIGSLVSEWSTARVSVQALAFLTSLSIVGHLVVYEVVVPYAVGLPRLVKVLLAFLFPAVPGLFMGQLFPTGLAKVARQSPGLVPWAIAVNGVAGTVASGAGVLLARILGIRAVILLGVLAYLVLALLPESARKAAVAREPE